MKIGTFILLKNESEYLGYHIMSILDYVDEIIFADGNSTDGSLEIIEYIKRKYDKKDKIRLYLDKDCKDLQEDYVNLFNWTLKQVKSDYAWFIHPDMICVNPDVIKPALETKGIRYSVKMTSIAGENRNLKFLAGRDDEWSTIYRNAFGLHYYGYYGAVEEDCYFSDFTGDVHKFWKSNKYLPYSVMDSGIKLVHYCDCKPYERRLGRMVSCLKNMHPDAEVSVLEQAAKEHPRVNLQDGQYGSREFVFGNNEYEPEVFKKYRDEFEPLRK